MPHVPVIRHLKTIVLVLIVSATVAGCSKKEEKPVAAATPADSETNVPVAATAPAAPAAASIPAPADIPVSTDVNQSIDEVDAALKANAYEKAAQTLLAMQKQSQLTDQQAQKAHSQMVSLQRSLANAIVNGDPNAKAAAELLRRSSLK
ncbi:MAG TPA: hypothetical protein VGH42_07085 [Verrucomicrobiae bacterium]|jgi:hypothetical protein